MALRPFRLILPLFAAALPAAARAVTMEAASADSSGLFTQALRFGSQVRFMPALPKPAKTAGGAAAVFEDSASLDKLHLHYLKEDAGVGTAAFSAAAAAPQPSRTIDLGPLVNRNLKAGLNVNLGGKNVWLSGVFDRGTFDRAKNAYVDPNAYTALSVDGEPTRLFNVKDLLSNPQTVTIGSGQFKIKLAPDLGDQLESEIVIITLANNHKDRITLRDLLKAVGDSGAALTLGGQVYKLFYYDEIKDGKLDPSNKLFAFIATDAKGEFHVFMIPADLVPADKTATFKMLGDVPMGLRRAGSQLFVFGNP